MKKFRVYYWILETFIKRYGKIIIPAAIIGALSFTKIEQILALLPQPKTTHRIARVGSYDLSNLPKDIQSKISQGLTTVDESGEVLPSLAQEWQVSEDGKTYTFVLKPNLFWQDGSPLTTQHIDYNINDVSSSIIDETTIQFNLQEPYSPFPSILSQPLFKRASQSRFGLQRRTTILGTGEYEIVSMSFSRNDLDQIIIESSKDRIIYHFYETEREAITAFKLAEVDTIEDLTSTAELAKWPTVSISEVINYNRYIAVFFNTKDPNLSDKAIRQALSYSIPNKPANEYRAYGPINPKSWAYNPRLKTYDYSLESAKDLFENKKSDFQIELTTTPAYTSLAESIKAHWEQLGPTVSIKVVNLPDTSNFQAMLIGQQTPLDPDQYLQWHSTQQSNITGYQSARVDKLLEDARKELDQNTRKEYYLDFQRFLVEDTPASFLFYLKTFNVERV